MKVHKGDTVLVIAGKDKGAKGKVIQAYPATDKVLVEGVNRIKKHTAVSANRARSILRRHRHAGSPDPRFQRCSRRLGRKPHPRGLPHRRRVRQARSDFPEEREGHLT